jgi:hypothetical protein
VTAATRKRISLLARMKIDVAKEIERDEHRVALTPAGALERAA